ncbi:MAG: dihydroorotase [Pseudomonadota bacterium]
MRSITITRPDDWHIHLRDGDYLADTVRDLARYFGRAIVMPNLVPPVADVEAAGAYRARILATGQPCEPLMTLYLTPETSPRTVREAARSGFIHAFKLYPAGATTNSDAGVSSITALYPVFEAMAEVGMVLAVHGEVTDPDIDIFDREAVFIDRILVPLCETFPNLKVVLEHVTTRDAVEFVTDARAGVAATITAHHLLYNRNDLLAGGMKPVYYCLPVLKRNTHQAALVDAAVSGNSRFFLGTDSAPHPRNRKEDACGCAAGCYTAHAAIELYAEVFAAMDKLDRLETFASFAGPDFYGLPRNSDTITLVEKAWQIPDTLPFGADSLVPIRAGDTVAWQVIDSGRTT